MANDTLQSLSNGAEKVFRAGKFAQAAELYSQALGLCPPGDRLRAAELSNNRSVALLQAGDASGALRAAEGTDVVFAQFGDTRRQALALGNQAAALDALGETGKALDLYTRCSDLLKQAGDNESRAAVLKSISALQVRTGRHLEALASMDAALNNQPRRTVKERFLKKLLDIPFKMLRG